MVENFATYLSCGHHSYVAAVHIGADCTMFFVLTETAKQYLIIMLIFTGIEVAYSVNTVIVCGIFPAGGDAKYDAISVFFATWCFALPVSLLGTFVFDWPVMMVYIIMCIDEIVKYHSFIRDTKKYLWLNNLTQEVH